MQKERMATAGVDERRANDSRVASKAKVKRLWMAERRVRERERVESGEETDRREEETETQGTPTIPADPVPPGHKRRHPARGSSRYFAIPGGWALGLRYTGPLIRRFISFPAFVDGPMLFSSAPHARPVTHLGSSASPPPYRSLSTIMRPPGDRMFGKLCRVE
jgi:hypothetical protein